MINGANTIQDLYFGNDLLTTAQKQHAKYDGKTLEGCKQNQASPVVTGQCAFNSYANNSNKKKLNAMVSSSSSSSTTPTTNAICRLNGDIFYKLHKNAGKVFIFNNNTQNISDSSSGKSMAVTTAPTTPTSQLSTYTTYSPSASVGDLPVVQPPPNNNQHSNNNNSKQTVAVAVASELAWCSPSKRTTAQENAFRCIEDVHNYAKLNRFDYKNESSNSSSLHDDDDEEDDEEVAEYEDGVAAAFSLAQKKRTENYATYFENRQRSISECQAKQGVKRAVSEDDSELVVDVETVPKELDLDYSSVTQNVPDHHARRPMNAFLIFCKRHRAIVKDRYKTLENRAITKILGDWWATLDANEKKCFTNLAKQNKDAFFSANPNFKWYKLPAPPLRTLNTRPSNAERLSEQKSAKNDFFKFADETQMGELSNLMAGVNNNNNGDKVCPLQQALSETTQFFNEHIPLNKWDEISYENCRALLQQQRKPQFHSELSISSNSSDETANAATTQRKLSRSCKGKIYQELINSGKIASMAKKLRNSNVAPDQTSDASMGATKTTANSSAAANDNRRCFSESETMSYDLAHFDLEERIKELPALSLDLYLQQKRNTKKKKKFTTKKRASNTTATTTTTLIRNNDTPNNSQHQEQQQSAQHKQPQQPQQRPAVGSQKRKARKESITRRDVSAIENEVTALITSTEFADDFPAAIKNCYFFNERTAPDTTNNKPAVAADEPQQSYNKNGIAGHDDILTATTSDLFILAEVAAKRTELMN